MILFKAMIAAGLLSCATAQAQVVAIATNTQGSSFYSVGAAVAGVMQQKAALPTRVQPMSGSSAYTPLVNRGQIEFGVLNSLYMANAYLGVENFKDHSNPDLRLVGALFVVPIGIAVPGDSPAKSIKDLKGLRMPSQFTAQTTMRIQQDAILATGGLSTADMKPFPVSDYLKGTSALGEGKVDAALACVGCGNGQEANIALASHGGMRFLPIPDTPEAQAAMHKLFPSAYTKMFEPSPALAGVVAPTRLMVYSGFLYTSTHVPADVVYRATKAIYENMAMLEAASPYMKTFDPKVMAEANTVPYHPGAERFFKEAKEWPPKKR